MSVLNTNIIENAARKVLSSRFTYTIKKSDNSESVYLTIFHDSGLSTALRFSDHFTTRTTIKTVLIKHNTKMELIERTILKSANGIIALSLRAKLGLAEIEKRKFKGIISNQNKNA